MSVRMALAKLCACTCGGAIIGGGAVHVAESARPAVVHSSKSTKAAPKKRYAVRTVKRKVVKTAVACAPQTVTVTSQPAPGIVEVGGVVAGWATVALLLNGFSGT